jgi:carboxypeptidase PM20D1
MKTCSFPLFLVLFAKVVETNGQNWTYPPFAAEIVGTDGELISTSFADPKGSIVARGAVDDKVSLVAILEAIETLLESPAGFHPIRSFYIVSGFDEEIGGRDGAAAIAKLLAERHVKFEFILDEGLLFSSSFSVLAAR